ncbi:hypothetical protein [Stenotrophomonas phage CM2]
MVVVFDLQLLQGFEQIAPFGCLLSGMDHSITVGPLIV